MIYDLIIIGGGPAGFSAGIYAARRSLKTLIVTKSIGGQVSYASEIENYPGIGKISGGELAGKMMAQATGFGVEIKTGEVKSLEQQVGGFSIKTATDTFQSKTVILAFGKTPRDLEVPGEDKFKGKGVSYCATCDALFFKNKTVAVIGGGNSAAESAILLAKTSNRVYLIHRRDQFTAEKVLVDELDKNPKCELILNSVCTEVKGDSVVRSLMIKDVITGLEREIKLDGIFVEIGFLVKPDFAKKYVDLDERNQIIVNPDGSTKTPGLFAAGDVTNVKYKQITIATGEGAKAALSAYDYLMKLESRSGVYSGNN